MTALGISDEEEAGFGCHYHHRAGGLEGDLEQGADSDDRG